MDLDPPLLRSGTARWRARASGLANSSRGSLSLSIAHGVRRHCDRDHDADDDLLNEGRDLQEVQAIAQEADDQDANGRTADASDAARQAGAPDDDGRNRVQLVAQARAWLRRVESSGKT